MIRRFGPASFEVSTGPSTKTLAYPSNNGGIDVELVDGRVTKVASAKDSGSRGSWAEIRHSGVQRSGCTLFQQGDGTATAAVLCSSGILNEK